MSNFEGKARPSYEIIPKMDRACLAEPRMRLSAFISRALALLRHGNPEAAYGQL